MYGVVKNFEDSRFCRNIVIYDIKSKAEREARRLNEQRGNFEYSVVRIEKI